MRKYYLFNLKNKDLKPSKIYNILEELFYLNKNKYKYGLNIFNNICSPFKKNEILVFLSSKYKINGNLIKIDDLEKTTIEIKNCLIIIECNQNTSEIFKYLNSLEKNIFVCDFKNKDYFYLNDFLRLNFKILT